MDGSQASRFTGGSGYRPLTEGTVAAYLATVPEAADRLGGSPDDWRVTEVGDGNLNLVFKVHGRRDGVVVKQALPYVRLVGASWPLPLDRAYFEHAALVEQAAHAPRFVPAVRHFDAAMALIVMELLEPHVILRKGLIAGTRYPKLADHIAEFLAETLFKTSDLCLSAAAKKERMAVFCANTELCKITEDLVFTDPYRAAPLNRWTSPQLDRVAAEFRSDADLKVAAQGFKLKFLTRAEAMIHGDLHSGSIMVTDTDTRAIDPEFAFYGPMGFDVGALLGNLLLAYFAQDGHAAPGDDREAHRVWILDQIEAIWRGFEERFLALWRARATGDGYAAELFADPAGRRALDQERRRYMARLFDDTVGFAGCKMIRRILGLAHVADLETIDDPDRRARCETNALRLGRALVAEHARFRTTADLRGAAEIIRQESRR